LTARGIEQGALVQRVHCAVWDRQEQPVLFESNIYLSDVST
jgi:hypothetical protein